jgi:hypothetical protein
MTQKVALQARQRSIDAVGFARAIAHPKDVDGLNADIVRATRVDLRFVNVELARGDGGRVGVVSSRSLLLSRLPRSRRRPGWPARR